MMQIFYSSLVLHVVCIFKEFKAEGFGAIFEMQNELHDVLENIENITVT